MIFWAIFGVNGREYTSVFGIEPFVVGKIGVRLDFLQVKTQLGGGLGRVVDRRVHLRLIQHGKVRLICSFLYTMSNQGVPNPPVLLCFIPKSNFIMTGRRGRFVTLLECNFRLFILSLVFVDREVVKLFGRSFTCCSVIVLFVSTTLHFIYTVSLGRFLFKRKNRFP